MSKNFEFFLSKPFQAHVGFSVSEDFLPNNLITVDCKIPEESKRRKSLSIDIKANRSERSLLFESIIVHKPDAIPGSNMVFFEKLKRKILLINPKIKTSDERLRKISPQRLLNYSFSRISYNYVRFF